MKNYIFRNYTIEYLFNDDYCFGGYGDVNIPSQTFQNYIIFYQVNPSSAPDNQILEIEDIRSKIDFLLNSFDGTGRVIIFSLQHIYNRVWESKSDDLNDAIDNFNHVYLKKLQGVNPNVKILDINSFVHIDRHVPIIDWRFFYTAQMVINPKLAKPFEHWYQLQKNALDLKRKKCIVLDCDNTLWGGVVGEEGTHGIKLGLDYPGICFRDFQQLLSILVSKGIILAICSKNNFTDVEDVWQNNRNNIINGSHISSYRINWENKAENIRAIGQELNIGLDSMVFIDDNPIERELVKGFLPEVEIPEFPKKPYELVSFFWEIYNQYFITYELSDEDLKKTTQYKQNFVRNESMKDFKDMDGYLKSLNIEIDIYRGDESNVARIAQMTQKTNQFNATTKRYTVEEIRTLINRGANVFCAGVKDKFGDNGITIAAILQQVKPGEIFIDSYLLSCRILGRDIERVVLLEIINYVKKESGIHSFKAQFIPTKKNKVANEFFDKAGFKLDKIDEDGVKEYSLLTDEEIIHKEFYKVQFIN